MSASSHLSAEWHPAYGGRGPEIVGVSWSLAGLTTLLLTLRVITRVWHTKTTGLQPLIWSWAAWVIATLGICFLTVATHYGLGNHLEIVEEAGTLVPAEKYQWIANAMISLAIGVGKFAIVTFYMEIEGVTHKWRQRALLLLVASNLANNIVLVFLIFFQCSPPASLWDHSIPGDCSLAIVNLNFGIAGGAWNAATDVILALYPIGIVWKLRMPRKMKFGLCILMGVGLFVAVCSIVKTVEFPSIGASQDPTWAVSPLILWGVAEMWVVLIAASVPPLWPLVRSIAERAATFSSRHSLSSLLNVSALGRPRRASSDDGMIEDSASEKSATHAGSSEQDRNDALEKQSHIHIQRDITRTEEYGRGSSVTSTAEGSVTDNGRKWFSRSASQV